MPTHGLYGFRMNDTNKFTFCHTGAELTNLCASILKFIKRTSDEDLKAFFNQIKMVQDNQTPTDTEFTDIRKTRMLKKVTANMKWSDILIQEEGNFDAYSEYIKNKTTCYMTDDERLLDNANLIVYAYIINLDNLTLEIYKGNAAEHDHNTYKVDDDIPITKTPWSRYPTPCKPALVIELHEIRTTLYPKALGDRIKKACANT